jgi:hypothetical protein
MAAKWGLQGHQKLTGSEIIAQVRMKVSDSMVNKFSDHEILNSLNEGIYYLWRALASHYSTLTHKIKEYDLKGTGALLPDDYQALVSLDQLGRAGLMAFDPVNNAYDKPSIQGMYIFGRGHVRMVYVYHPKDINRADDVIDVPMALMHDLVAITANLVTNQADRAISRADETAKRVSQTREIGPVPAMVAFP